MTTRRPFGRSAAASSHQRCETNPSDSIPKTSDEGERGTASTTSWIGVACATPGARATRSASETGRTDAVGSETLRWKSPRSAWPRWISPRALFWMPWVSASSATIVATPTAIPVAVSSVRARWRNRLARISPTTAAPMLRRPPAGGR